MHGEATASGSLDRSSTGRTTLILGDDRLEDADSTEFDAFNKHWDQPLHKALFPLQHEWVDKDIRHHVKTWMGRRMEMNDVEKIDPEMTDLYKAALDQDDKLVKLIDKLDYQKTIMFNTKPNSMLRSNPWWSCNGPTTPTVTMIATTSTRARS